MEEMLERILADVAPIIHEARRIQEIVKELRRRNTWDLENFEPFGFAIYCEFAKIALENIADHLEPEMTIWNRSDREKVEKARFAEKILRRMEARRTPEDEMEEDKDKEIKRRIKHYEP